MSDSDFGDLDGPAASNPALPAFFAEDLSSESDNTSHKGVVDRIRASRSGPAKRAAACIERLQRLGIEHHVVQAALRQSELTGSWVVHELVSGGHVSPDDYFRQLAADIGVEYASHIEVERIVKEASAPVFRVGRTAQICCRRKDGLLVNHVAPDSMAEAVITATLERFPAKKTMFRIVQPATVQAALEKLRAAQSAEAASNRLYLQSPQMSAKFTLVSWQAFLLGILVLGIPMAAVLRPWETYAFLHVLVLVTFGLATATRIAAFAGLLREKRLEQSDDHWESGFPVYSVLVALHKEAAVAPQIVRAMARLDWPQSRLEIIYVCEEDDHETQEALRRIRLPPSHRILCVPPVGPRTKPKALNFALDQCSGELVVIYDAEDRPDPMQLREAWRRFSSHGPELACLQAPLLVTNARQGWLSSMFAVEYACHFYALLPFLSRQGAPLPLGGTSNHFRRQALEKVGAWDPYNVTEDADLGIRFFRHGYRCSVIGRPTFEDGPSSLAEWIPQRTRWIKGWMQTFLVHNRNSNQLLENIGTRNLVLFEILMISFIFSPLLYAMSILAFLLIYFLDDIRFGSNMVLIYLDLAVFLGGHVSYWLLSASAWREAFKSKIPIVAALTFPAYWVLGTYAAWRAVWKLIRAPFEWEKTSHKPVSIQVLVPDRDKPFRSQV